MSSGKDMALLSRIVQVHTDTPVELFVVQALKGMPHTDVLYARLLACTCLR